MKRMNKLMVYTALPAIMAAAGGCANIAGGIAGANNGLHEAMYGASNTSYSQMCAGRTYSAVRRDVAENNYYAIRYANAAAEANGEGFFSGYCGFMRGLGNAGRATSYAADGVGAGAGSVGGLVKTGADTITVIHDAFNTH